MTLDPAQFRRIEEVFEAVIQLPSSEREGYLKRTCKDDRGLLDRVKVLLDEDAKHEIDAPTRGLVNRFDLPLSVPAAHSPPERIGRYRIIRECGRGGMGTVYEAVQDNPERRVALKMIRPGMMTRQLMQRFRYETEFLGRLQHAGVGQIFEAGVIDLGAGEQPYFVMEFIDGSPLLEHIRREELGTSQRLMLFVMVCDAIHHAHQRGVIHRDLKPENILVVPAEHDSGGSSIGHYASMVGQPKVLDFGIARATDADLQATMQTDAGALVGTLQYMSPEQAAGDSQSLDVRSDIYALGVILFEVLSDKTPYDLAGRNIAESIQIICEGDPSRLSSIHSRFRGDLETIVGKCLEKEPERRYASASDLAADVRRHLQHEPISARPPSTWYQVRKFSRRNRQLVFGVMATVLALTIGLIGTVMYAFRAGQSESVALGEAYRASITAASSLMPTDPVTARGYLSRVPETQRGWEWRHLYSQLDRHDMVYEAPVAPVGTIVVTSDGTRVVSALQDNRIAVWDAASGALVRTIPIEHEVVVIAAPSDGSSKIAIGTRDGRVLVSDLSTQEPREVYRMVDQLIVTKLAWSDDGTLLAAGTSSSPWFEPPIRKRDGRIVILRDDAVAGELKLNREQPLGAMEFSPDGTKLAVLMPGLTIIDVASATVIGQQRIDDDDPLTLAFSADGSLVLVATHQRSIFSFDAESLEHLGRYAGHQGSVRGIATSRHGELLASSGSDGTIRLWNVKTGAPLAVVHTGTWTPVAFSHDSARLLYRRDKTILSRDLSVEPATVLHGHTSYAYFTNFSDDGSMLVSAERFGPGVFLWDPIAGQAIRRYTAEGYSTGVQLSEDGRRVVTDYSGVIDTVTGQSTRMAGEFQPNRHYHPSYAMDARATRAAIGAAATHYAHPAVVIEKPEGGVFSLYDFAKRENEIVRFEGDYYGLALSPDGTLLAAGSDSVIDIWEVDSKERVAQLIGHTSQVYTLDFSPDGARLASGSNDNSIRIWDTKSWQQVGELRGHKQYVKSVAFSSDGTQLASASGDYTVRIWDTVPRFERAKQARAFAERMERVRPKVEEMMKEQGDAGVVADQLEPGFPDQQDYSAALRVLIQMNRDGAPR